MVSEKGKFAHGPMPAMLRKWGISFEELRGLADKQKNTPPI